MVRGCCFADEEQPVVELDDLGATFYELAWAEVGESAGRVGVVVPIVGVVSYVQLVQMFEALGVQLREVREDEVLEFIFVRGGLRVDQGADSLRVLSP